MRADARRGPTPSLVSARGHTYDDLRQGMSEQMLEMLMGARIKSEKRLSARSA